MTRRRQALALLAAAGSLSAGFPAVALSAGIPAKQQSALVSRFLTDANAGHIGAVAARFTPAVVMRVGSTTWHGRDQVRRWWRAQMRAHVHLVLVSSLHTSGATTRSVIRRHTSGADCARGCDEQAVWRFTGTRVNAMSLQPIHVPAPPPVPFKTVPPPPTARPAPNVTPTIPT